MATLLQQLDEYYPDWRAAHSTPEEAGVEIGLLDSEDDEPDYKPLNFHDPRS